jgi:transposase
MQDSMFIGLDVHKATISVAFAKGERGGEVRHWGTISHRPDHIRKLVEKLGADGCRLRFCYEAGPCGYGLHRQLVELGHDCIVVAPSLIPVKAGDRVKTDRRDAAMLAKLHRAEELTAVWVPDAAHEAMRDLVRGRATAVRVTGKARQHLQGFLLRHGRIYPGKKGWTKAYRRWLTTVRFEHPAQQIVLQDYIDAVTDAEARIERLTGQIADLLPSWTLAPVVEGVQAMRGGRVHRRRDGSGRSRRFLPVRQSAAVDGLSRADALGTFQRRQRAPRRHHQGRQRTCQAGADRRRVELPDAGPRQS